jgi:hypothetical protein
MEWIRQWIFFHSLDNGRYADFKVQYLNGFQVKSIKAPNELITISDMASNCLKPKALAGKGYASTYATKVDYVEKKRADEKTNVKTNKSQNKEQGKQSASRQNKDVNQESGKK